MSLLDEWVIVRCPDGGFIEFFAGQWNGDFAARNFERIGLPRIAEIYRRAQRLLPPGCPKFGWDPRKKLAPTIRRRLEALTGEIREADEEIAEAVAAYLQTLASLSENACDPEVPGIFYELREDSWVESN